MKKSILVLFASFQVLIPAERQFASETIPHSFSAGDIISAEMMNEVFSKINNVTTGFSSSIDILGTWECKIVSISCIGETGFTSFANGLAVTRTQQVQFTDDGDGTFSYTTSDWSLIGCWSPGDPSGSKTNDYYISNNVMFVKYEINTNIFPIQKFSPESFLINTSHSFQRVYCNKQNLAPKPPQSLTYANSSSSITLTWTDDQTETVTGYKVLRKTVLTDDFTTISTITDNTTRTYEDTDVSTGSYWYRVRAYNSNGDGIPSKVVKSEFP